MKEDFDYAHDAGYDAGRFGFGKETCPFTTDAFVEAWLKGYDLGREDLKDDRYGDD